MRLSRIVKITVVYFNGVLLTSCVSVDEMQATVISAGSPQLVEGYLSDFTMPGHCSQYYTIKCSNGERYSGYNKFEVYNMQEGKLKQGDTGTANVGTKTKIIYSFEKNK